MFGHRELEPGIVKRDGGRVAAGRRRKAASSGKNHTSQKTSRSGGPKAGNASALIEESLQVFLRRRPEPPDRKILAAMRCWMLLACWMSSGSDPS